MHARSPQPTTFINLIPHISLIGVIYGYDNSRLKRDERNAS